MKTRILFFFITIILLMGCKSFQKVKASSLDWDLEKYMNEAQKNVNKDKYQKAIDLLKEASSKFTDETIGINYNIAFYYYKMKKYSDAEGYFNSVIQIYENEDLSEAQKQENKKFVILSTSMIDKIKKDKEDAGDPYHVKEDIERSKEIKAKKNK